MLKTPLPCPFCGKTPEITKTYWPTEIGVSCKNPNCPVHPSVWETTTTVENPGDSQTFTPQFDLHYDSIITKWNKRG